MRQVDDGKEYVFNRGDPVGGSISHSNNELQEVSRGHSSNDAQGNLRRAKARTDSSWSKKPDCERCMKHQPRGVFTPYAHQSREGRRNNTWLNEI